MARREINAVLEELLSLEGCAQKARCKEILADDDFFNNSHPIGSVYGTLNEAVLHRMVLQSAGDEDMAGVLAAALECADAYAVSDEIFQLLLNFPQKGIQSRIQQALSHCVLSIYQLEYLFSQCNQDHAFGVLLNIYMKNECFTPTDLQILLERGKRFWQHIDFYRLLAEPITPEKKACLKAFACLQN